MGVVHPSGDSQHERGAKRAIRGLKMGVTGFVWYQLYMFLSVALEFGWLRFFFLRVSSISQLCRLQCRRWRQSLAGCGKSARPHQDAHFFFEPDFQRFKNASTHVENLSQSDKTDVANALFQHGQQTRCLPVLARAPVLGIFYRLCWSSMFQNFCARGGDAFLRMYSRWAPITFDTL